MTIGNRISQLRKEFGYSQEYVAEKLDVSRQAVSKWEQDQSAPDTYNLIALAELFHVSVEYIATGKTEQSEQAPVQQPKSAEMSVQKRIGFILFAAGLLGMILGALLSEVLLVFSLMAAILGLVCIAVRQMTWVKALWTAVIISFLFVRILVGKNPLFLTAWLSFVKEEKVVTGSLIMSTLFWVLLVTAAALTAKEKTEMTPFRYVSLGAAMVSGAVLLTMGVVLIRALKATTDGTVDIIGGADRPTAAYIASQAAPELAVCLSLFGLSVFAFLYLGRRKKE